ncbi:hypothetical protein JCM8097_008895 [Rhodosporidiobolus ruineniae]
MPPRSSKPAPSSSRLDRIDSAFNTAAGYSDTSTSPAAPTLSAKTRGKRRAAVPDDEEDEPADEEMEEVAPASTGEGGFMTGADEEMSTNGVGGGFLPEDAGPGGGFLLDDANGGGFLPLPLPPNGGGGFLPDDSAASAEAAGGGFLPDPPAGGFLHDPPSAADDTAMPDASSFSGGGFFSSLPGDASFAGAGGFLPSASDDDGDASFELPTPAPLTHAAALSSPSSAAFPSTSALPLPSAPPDRIPLAYIPSALRQLGLTSAGLAEAELLSLFEDVASDDEDAEGGKSVRRERFREACEVLMQDLGSDVEEGDEVEEGGAEEYRDDEEDDVPVVRRRRGPTRATRSSTRRAAAKGKKPAAVVDDDEEEEDGAEGVKERDFGGEGGFLPGDEEEEDEAASDEEDSDASAESEDSDGAALPSVSSSSKKRSSAPGRSRSSRASRPLTARDLADAADSFDLFFVGSLQEGKPRGERTIGLMELQRAARVLKEKIGDGELNEMLEYAARSEGKVGLKQFARILVETGL